MNANSSSSIERNSLEMASSSKKARVSSDRVDQGACSTPGKKKIRFCAYCLQEVPEEFVLPCEDCKDRVYCSTNCRKVDWDPKEDGQEHATWCHLRAGEEGVHWEVRHLGRDKGMGIVALRPMPPMFRIMVDTIRPRGHPRIDDLMPEDEDREGKYIFNCFGTKGTDGTEEGNSQNVIGLRIARANHNCHANAGHLFDIKLKVGLFFLQNLYFLPEPVFLTIPKSIDIFCCLLVLILLLSLLY